MRKRLPIIVITVIVVGLILFAAHSFDLMGLARSLHGG